MVLGARSILLLAACLQVASAVRADDVGYVECGAHPEGSTVYNKARKSQDIVGTLPCGERFTILLYGFVFSRIETSDNQIGYVFSSLITVDRSMTVVRRSASGLVAPASAPKLPPAAAPATAVSAPPAATQSTPATPPSAPAEQALVRAVPVQPKPEESRAVPAETASAEVTLSNPTRASTTAGGVAPAISTPDANPQPALAPRQPPASALPNPTPASTSSSPEVTSSISGAARAEARGAESAPAAQPGPLLTTQTDIPPPSSPTAAEPSAAITPADPPAAVQPTSVPSASELTPGTAAATSSEPHVSEASAPATPPDPPATSQPVPPAVQPSASQPLSSQPKVAPARAREASMRSSWERPHPTGRRQSLVELYAGYAYARLDNGTGTFTNLNGALGAFGVNILSWLQLAGDTSYNFVTASGVKTQLYGNHYGPRLFYRPRSRWIATPFAEALFGGTRLTTSVSGGSSTSDNEFSMKFGGGLDIRPSRHIEFRVLEVDYYRTSFGTNLHQNNYWATTGIVLRLFGGRAE